MSDSGRRSIRAGSRTTLLAPASPRTRASRLARTTRATPGAPPTRTVHLPRGTAAALATALAAALAGCASGGGEPDASRGTPTSTLTVYAAASLTEAFEELATRFEAEHPSIDVAPIVADGSSILARQIIEGARADVLATADEVTMASVDDEGLLASEPRIFAENVAVLAAPAGDPAGVGGLAGLTQPGVRLVVCAPDVPCGSAAHELFEAAGLRVTAASEEQNVTGVLTKLTLGEADAGVIYGSDLVRADGAVEQLDTSAVPDVVSAYPIAPLAGATDPGAADAFVTFVLSPAGQQVLAEFGFAAP